MVDVRSCTLNGLHSNFMLSPKSATSGSPILFHRLSVGKSREKVQSSSLGCRRACDALLGANEGEQVGVDLVRMRGGHSVRQAGIGLKRSVLQEFDRSRAGC